MKKIRKVLLALLVTAASVALFAIGASAAEYNYAHVKTFVNASAYADITFKNGWVQVATSASTPIDGNGDGVYDREGDLMYTGGYKAYYNESTKTLVIEGSSSSTQPSASSGDWQNKTDKFPYWCNVNSDKVETLEIRNVAGFNNTGYIIRPLTNVKTVKIDTMASHYRGSKDDTALLAGLSSLTTCGFGSWDKTTGRWSPSPYFKEGTIDLRGFTTLQPQGTISNIPDLIMYMGSMLMNSSSVKDIILPSALSLSNSKDTYSVANISDGSDAFPYYDGSGNVPKGTIAYKLTNDAGEIAYGKTWQTPTGWTAVRANTIEIEPYLGEFSGMIPYQFASGAKELQTVTVPEDVTMYRIYKDAFKGCTTLHEIKILGTIDDSFTVDAGAFGTGSNMVSGVEIEVSSVREVEIVNAALDAAGYTDRNVVRAVHMLINPITADGFQIKINTEYNGLRGLFSFNESSKADNAELGYKFVEYGVAVCTKTMALSHATNMDIVNSTSPKVKRIAIENADGTGANRYVDYASRQFCIALIDIPLKNSMDDIYFLAYSIWREEESGIDRYSFTTYVTSDNELSVNLYEVTMGLLKNGLVNSETVNYPEACIWGPLQTGAVTIAADAFAAPGTPKNASTGATYKLNIDAAYNEDGSFTYLNQKLYNFIGATSGNYSFNPSGFEDTATTNVIWSLYKWNGEYIAVYRRDPDAAADAKAMLPTQSIPDRKAIHPFREGYGALNTNQVSGDVTIHFPVLTADEAAKVKTLILDYGIDSTESGKAFWANNGSFALGNSPYLETIVYPNGFAPYSDSESLFRNDKVLKNVIWANKPAENSSHVYHMGDIINPIVDSEPITSLADLRGMGKIDSEAAFMDAGFENIVFAGFAKDSFTQTFSGSQSISRVWISGSGSLTPPAARTIDLSLDTTVTKINRQSFSNITSEGYTVKLSDKVTSVVPYTTSFDSAFGVTFGSKLIPVSIEAANPAFEGAFYDYLVSLKDTKYRVNPQNVTVNGKTYKQIRDEVCFKDSQLVIYPELDARINRSFDYKVSVHQGTDSAILPVYNHTMFNSPGGRSVGGDIYRRYSMFAFCGDRVRVDIKVGCDFTKYSVIPSSKNFETSFDAATGTISVYLDKPDYFAVRLDDDDNSIISIIADMPEYPDEQLSATSGDTIYIGDWYAPQAGDGITETTDGHKGTLYITKDKNDYTLYIAPGAVLYGRVRLDTVTDFTIIGRGVIVDPFEDSRVYDIRDGGTEGGGQYTNPYKSQLLTINGNNVYFDGPTLMDARCFNLTAGGRNITVRNYKAFSSMMTTDGITDGTKGGSSFEHCWLYCGDNALVVSGSTDSYYNDITIGTTCAAIFPQANVRNALLENIYVFRSNDGIINHRYNPNNDNLVATLTFRNFDCMDTVNYPQFFGGSNMGTSTEKVFTFENLALPTASNITDPHATVIANSTSKGARLVEIGKSSSQIDTTNYTFNFINTYVNGQLIDNRSKAIISEYSGTSGNTYNFSSSNNGYTAVQKIDYTVNYTAPGKVYIGTLGVSFENDVIIEGGTFYLPADEILAKLRTSVVPTKVTKNGIEYIAHTALASSGAAKSAVVSGGNLTVTPVAPSASANLIVQNSGLVTREYETTCYHIDLVQNKGDGVMYAYPHAKQYNGGIGYHITEEVKMYGAGKYTLKLKARCVPLDGGGYSQYQLAFTYDNNDVSKTAYSTTFYLTDDWVEYWYTFEVTDAMLEGMRGASFFATAAGSVPIDHYEVKDVFIGFNTGDTAYGGNTTDPGTASGGEETEPNPIDSLSLKRGINISLLESESKVSFPIISFGSNNNNFIKNASTYTDIKAQGFDHVRLPVNFHTYYSNGTVNSSFLSTLDTIINTILDSGLTVILDFHGWSAINSDVDANKAEFYDIWTEISERYKDYPDQLLFELLNEPHEEAGNVPLTAAKLNEIQNEAIKIVRKTNPKRIIVASGPEWNSWWGLEDLTLPTDDPNIIVDVHTYQPYDFTHQGSERWTDPNAVMTPVELYGEVFTEINKVVKYCGQFTEKTGIKVWLGEFGVYLYIAENVDVTIKDDITEYLAYVSKSMEDAGIPWAYWEYNSGFGAYDSSSKAWKDYVMNGLTRRSDAN